jgi:cell wall-associated NlpC family hydrolase
MAHRIGPLFFFLIPVLVACTPNNRSSAAPVVVTVSIRATPAPVHVEPVTVRVPTVGAVAATPTPLPVEHAEGIEALVVAAKSWIGVRYAWGGCSKAGVDCSCFVRNVLAVLGINAPRVTTQQIKWATPISASEARAGDLVFFDNTCSDCGANPTHVGLYLGGGTMIDAGDPVRVEPVYGGHNARYGRPPGL